MGLAERSAAEAAQRIADALQSANIDVFLPSIPFSHEAARTRIQITDATGWTGWFLSAEALTLFKLLFFPID